MPSGCVVRQPPSSGIGAAPRLAAGGAGGGLPPMVLTFIACSIPRSRPFWERYAAGY